jgi:hypothetical protein
MAFWSEVMACWSLDTAAQPVCELPDVPEPPLFEPLDPLVPLVEPVPAGVAVEVPAPDVGTDPRVTNAAATIWPDAPVVAADAVAQLAWSEASFCCAARSVDRAWVTWALA